MNVKIQFLRLIQYLSRRGWLKWLPDESYLSLVFRLKFGKNLDLQSPKTFNEKLQWLKLYDRNDEYTVLVDKFLVRQVIAEKIGEEYLVPLLGVWDSPNDITFSDLPERFVLKCTHDSGGIIICRSKNDLHIESTIKKLNKSFRNNGYGYGREWPYKNIKKKVIAEAYLENNGDGLIDYKLFCFSGEVKCILVCQNRYAASGLTEDFYTPEWEHIPVKRPNHENGVIIDKPQKLDEMIDLAKTISKGFPFLRVDFYIVNEKVYFGELTFYPASGFSGFVPEKYDHILGDWLVLPYHS